MSLWLSRNTEGSRSWPIRGSAVSFWPQLSRDWMARGLLPHQCAETALSSDFLFRGVQGHPLATITYRRAWDKARRSVLTAHEYRSPLARRPYDLRHACLSTWLNGGVPATQVAEWAGHSVEMLLRVYAKCLDGQDEIARRRITAALNDSQ